VALSAYAANTPVRFRADIDMDTKTWECTIDDELNGFWDDQLVPGLIFVNSPSIITNVGTVSLNIFGSFSACAGSRVVAFDNVLITNVLPIFADGFESGDTDQWSTAVP
jgi:hypothetical protein